MSEHTEHQIIRSDDGAPLFALVPWDEYTEAFGGKPDEDVIIPHEVVGLHVVQGLSLIRAWREHLGLTQGEVALRMGISRPALAQMERPDAKPRFVTLKKIAAALGIDPEQLRE
ncbi:MAG: helix-turn-helix transcriptional regulator [Desulfovibrio sp.]|jgi:DNA-binding XRE family transcriptional regulator|nr:helix-turn-helix transcriptional regulator [Desulfovibrio sp.]